MSENLQNEEMKRYIFQEMSEEEYDAVEELSFEDKDYFYQLAELETDIIDRYAKGILSGTELTRFEKSIEKVPGRKNKIAQARALQNLIAEEKPTLAPITEPGLWAKFLDLFKINFGLQYATAGLALLLISLIGYLVYQNRLIKQELARQQDLHNQEIFEKEKNIQTQLEELRQQLENEKGKSETLIDVQNERQAKIESLEQQLDTIRKQKNLPPQNQESQTDNPLQSTLATFLLIPGGGRNNGTAELISIKPEIKRINLILELPTDSQAKTFDVKLNDGKTLATKQKPLKGKAGKRFIRLTISVQDFGDQEHTIYLIGDDESQLSYPVRLQIVK